MIGKIVVAAYKPRPGKGPELAALIREHIPRLRRAGLVTEREPIAAVTSDGTVIEVFEWLSEEAIASAHTHPDVQRMWAEFEACCWYETPANVADFARMFVSLEPLT